jgi:hypothetical protein
MAWLASFFDGPIHWAKVQKADDLLKARIFGVKMRSNGDPREAYVVPD